MDDQVNAVAASGNDVYVGGTFKNAGGLSARRIAKWNGSQWFAIGSGMNDFVYALALSGNDLYAGGEFLIAGDKVSGFVARADISVPPSLSILRSGNNVLLQWPSAGSSGFFLERLSAFSGSAIWTPSSAQVADDGTNKSATISAPSNAQFFRLHKP